MQLIDVARDSRAIRSGLISHNCKISIYGVYKIRIVCETERDKEQERGTQGVVRWRAVSWPLSSVDARGRHRNYANCGSVLACSGLTARGRASRPAGSGRPGRRRMAHRGDSGTFTYAQAACYVPRTRSIAFVSLRERRGERFEWDGRRASVVLVVGCCERVPVCRADALATERVRLPASNWRGVAHFSAGIRVSSSLGRKLREYVRSREKRLRLRKR